MTRIETDAIGQVQLNDHEYYGIQTKRALDNFDISNSKLSNYPIFIEKLAIIKKCVAIANQQELVISDEIAQVIQQVSDEIISGKWREQFPVDIYQGGGGTSINMNVNEVIANRANEILTGAIESKIVHPNSHVNYAQSTNDVVPAAMKLSAYVYTKNLIKSVQLLENVLEKKVFEFANYVKVARTCLQDALPITVGQQFSGYLAFIKRQIEELNALLPKFLVLPLGATAIGTSIGAYPTYCDKVYDALCKELDLPITKDENFFDALQNADIYLKASDLLKNLSTGLSKFASDLRILSSGPRAGIGELTLPSVQLGSSIMPGKINPCMPEMMMQVAFDVYGKNMAITFAADRGELDLNIWEPIIIKNLFDSYELLTNCIELFTEKCVAGIEVNVEKCAQDAENSLALSVIASSKFGYDVGTQVTQFAHEHHISVKEAVIQLNLIDRQQADKLFKPENLINL